MRWGRFIICTKSPTYSLGIYVTNWGYPIRNEWEIGIDFFKWTIGLELYK